MQKIVIDRSKWRNGGNNEPPSPHACGIGFTKLRNAEGYQCCLGFICEQSTGHTGECHYPAGLGILVPYLTEQHKQYRHYQDTQLTVEAICINDSENTTPQEKEVLLKELFAGKYELEFVGEYFFSGKVRP